MYYLEHESIAYTSRSGRTYTIYGSPVCLLQAPCVRRGLILFQQSARLHRSRGAFQYLAGHGHDIYARIPSSTDILMTHTPPEGICDTTKRGERGGCADLRRRLEHRDLGRCRLHVYGHIHEARKVAVVDKTERNPSGRVSANAAMPNFPLPVIVDLLD